MIDPNKVREALMLVVGSAVESKYELGFVIPATIMQTARAALQFRASTVRFADGKFGCHECGNYADPITGEVNHRVTCRIFERATETKCDGPKCRHCNDTGIVQGGSGYIDEPCNDCDAHKRETDRLLGRSAQGEPDGHA